MKYYKITNKLEFHNGHQYKNGMNILPDTFNDDENVICGAGGFYFTTAEHIHNFYYLGENVRVIEIPKNKHCKVIKTNNIYRSNMIILKEKYNFNVSKDLIEILKINKNTLDIVNYFSLTNNVKMLKWLKSNNVFEYDEKTINYACFSGHVPVLNFMDCYDFKYDENAINYACFNGHVNVLEWFKHSKRPFIYTTWAISLACQNNHVHVLEWFKNSSYDFKYDENAIHNAAQYNNIAVLKWFKKNNYLIIFNDEYVLNHSNEKILTWFIEQSLLKM